MPDLGFISMQLAKASFFDRQKVIDAVGRAWASNMAKSGGLVRKIMRQSMRRRKKSAAPGQAPSAHAGQLKELIFFGYDSSDKSEVIGPIRFKEGEVPHLLEFGGTIVRKNKSRKGRTLTYAGNPFAKPALDVTTPKLPAIWANSVKP